MVTAVLAVTAAPARADVIDDNPAAASRGPGDVYVFARGGDGQTYERHWTGSAFSDWSTLGGQATSGPAAAPYGSAINVLVRGTDDALWQNSLLDGRWLGWHSLGGGLTSAPAATTRRGTQVFDVLVRGTDNQLHHRYYAPATRVRDAQQHLTTVPRTTRVGRRPLSRTMGKNTHRSCYQGV